MSSGDIFSRFARRSPASSVPPWGSSRSGGSTLGGVSGLSLGTKSETGKSRLIRDNFVAVVIDDETCRAAIGQGGPFCRKSEEECRVQAHASSHCVKLESGPALAVVRDS